MSMPIVHHVLQKSQTRSSARTLLLTLAVHANECCGVAWPSETTLMHEVNISLQRLHELKQALPTTGELVIVRRPGRQTLYFVAWHGQPLGPQGEYLAQKSGEHQPGCPLRHHPVDLPTYSSRIDPVEISTGYPVGQPTDTPQVHLRRKQEEREKNNRETFSLSQEHAANAAREPATNAPQPRLSMPQYVRLTPGSAAYRLLYGTGEPPDTTSEPSIVDGGIGAIESVPQGTLGYTAKQSDLSSHKNIDQC
jgi:hypothetical protein